MAYDATWLTCMDDEDCVKVYDCADMAINKSHEQDWTNANRGACDKSVPPNHSARAICVQRQCALTDASAGTAPEWFTCQQNSDCAKIYDCADVAINKNYIDAYKVTHQGACRASEPPNPQVFAQCAGNQCTLVLQEKQK